MEYCCPEGRYSLNANTPAVPGNVDLPPVPGYNISGACLVVL